MAESKLLKAAENLSVGLHVEEVRGLIFSPEFDALWEELTDVIRGEYEKIGRSLS